LVGQDKERKSKMASNLVKADEVATKVCEALGVDPGMVSRVVLDLTAGQPVTAYVEMYGDERFLSIQWTLDGAVIEYAGQGDKKETIPTVDRIFMGA
jgi:hypothetical protein